ncbi:MAG: hypothetical protein K2L73_06145 [Muribaculaceae bacterium]|nr:hypothetical protein [Muribaculaceae bacterium]
MTFSEILNVIIGGGLVVTLLQVITLKAAVRKANAEAAQAQAEAKKAEAEAEKAKADAEGVRITNTENATRILMDNIVKPLKEELHATREDLHTTKEEMVSIKGEMVSTKREMQRLRKAVAAATNCPHSDGCPVLCKLRDNQKDSDGTGADNNNGKARYRSNRNKTNYPRNGPEESNNDCNIRGQPP